MCRMNTIQYSLYATGVSLGPPKSSTQTASRSLQPFWQGSLGDRPTGRPTDHATRSVTISGSHSGEAKFFCCLRGYNKYLKNDIGFAKTAEAIEMPFASTTLVCPPVAHSGPLRANTVRIVFIQHNRAF